MPCGREYARRYKQEHREQIRQDKRRYRQTHEKEERARKRKYAQENLAKERERRRRYRRENSQAIFGQRRARQGAGGSFATAEWNALVNHYGNKCLRCGRTDVKLTVDHIVPIAKGGSSNIDNLQPLCASCNSHKRDMIIDYRPDSKMPRWVQGKLFKDSN